MSEDVNKKINMDLSDDAELDPQKVQEALEKLEENDDEPRTVHVSCRRNQHLDGRPGSSSGDGDLRNRCDANTAHVVSDAMSHTPDGQVVYRCTECNYTWSATTGTHINI